MKLLNKGQGFRVCVIAGCVAVGVVVLLPGPQTTVSAASSQEGATLFNETGCVQCHGPTGLGTAKGPSLRDVRKRLSAEQVHRQIKEGGQSMPPFGEALTEPQIDQLVEFLRSKKAWKQPLPTQ